MKNLINDFGADPTAQTDSSAAFQAALNYGGDIELGEGSFQIDEVCHATKPVRLFGEYTRTALLAGPSIPSNHALIVVSPNTAYGADGYEFDGFQIAPLGSSSSAAAICLNTTGSGQYLRGVKLRRLLISQMADQSVVSVNANQDGLAGLLVEQCTMMGGIFLNNCGDSLQIKNNLISGSGIGVFASFVAGATTHSIVENNIVSKGGAVYLVNPQRTVIRENNIESSVYGYNGGVDAQVYIQGAQQCDIVYNSFQGGTVVGNARLNACNHVNVVRNRMFTAQPHKHILTQGGAANLNYDNQYVDVTTGQEVGGWF